MSSKLFTPLRIRDLIIKNRIFMAPMCQYSAVEGVPNEWHHTHLTTRAVGGVGLLIVEAAGVVPEGRISKQCLGIYNQAQVELFKAITKAVKALGGAIGIQLAHSGRKGDSDFALKAPSSIPFSASYKTPEEMTVGVLDFAKLDSGALVLETVDFNLPDLVEGIALQYRALAAEKAVAVRVEADADQRLARPACLRQHTAAATALPPPASAASRAATGRP